MKFRIWSDASKCNPQHISSFLPLNGFKCNNMIHTLASKKINDSTRAVKVTRLFITGITRHTKEIKKKLLILICYLVGFSCGHSLAHEESWKISSFSHVTYFKFILDVVPGMLMMVHDNVSCISSSRCRVCSGPLLLYCWLYCKFPFNRIWLQLSICHFSSFSRFG